jgi:phosphoribosylformylglycinamidine synthase
MHINPVVNFFKAHEGILYVILSGQDLPAADVVKLSWLLGGGTHLKEDYIAGDFIGPLPGMVTPWSTNAVEICQNMGIDHITRFEKLRPDDGKPDLMVERKYSGITKHIFDNTRKPEPVQYIEDIAAYNQTEGLALSDEEIEYLEKLSQRLGRKLTDSEVFGFSQVNSEHCRHKIFNGTFIIDGEEKPLSLFRWIKKTSETHPNDIVSAYKDNVAFLKGPEVIQFAPKQGDEPSVYEKSPSRSILSLKAETHNFPTTVEPFSGAATGSGGEIRDRLAGGTGSLPLAGTAVYMTPYSRINDEASSWQLEITPRKWLYQTPVDILIKASNGASDFGNKYGQPLIAGSLMTFEQRSEADVIRAYDKVIMLAGGVGIGKQEYSRKQKPEKGDKIVVMGGDNYRIGMGGAAVSSADTGAYASGIELNAVQRSNPEMQKRVANTIRALVESGANPIVSIHDHGAGGHLNCLSELVEETGGIIYIDQLPVGDPSLSFREIIGNESQERMGLIVKEKDLKTLRSIAERERAPMYVVGEITGDHRLIFRSENANINPIDLRLSDMFGSSPVFVMKDSHQKPEETPLRYDAAQLERYLHHVLQLEGVACKDWLTNKVDRCVTGRVAVQQCTGPLQLPLNNCGVAALDYDSCHGIATSIGHSPLTALVSPAAGSRNSIAEALTNLIWAPLEKGLDSVSLSANWMWPCKNPGQDAALYEAVQACAEFAIALGINIPTGKDSLSMKQKYPDREVLAPGTVIISAAGHCDDIENVLTPVISRHHGSLYYINLSFAPFALGGSAFAQTLNAIGQEVPDIRDAAQFRIVFNAVQRLIRYKYIVAGHDIGSGGLITTLLEMCFADNGTGAEVDLTNLGESDDIKLLFSENAGIVFQAAAGHESRVEMLLQENEIKYHKIGSFRAGNELRVTLPSGPWVLDIPYYRDVWYKMSYLLDSRQSGPVKAAERYSNYKRQPLKFHFPFGFTGLLPDLSAVKKKFTAAVIREKGSNSERELAHALYLAGFEVRDVHMTDLITGRETLEDVHFIGAVGGFSNSDVLGSAKGWAGAFLYNEKAKQALNAFFERKDTLSVGICNGCQLFIELGLINPEHDEKPHMTFNDSRKHESAFTSVTIGNNHSVMLGNLAGTTLGVWISHGEGKFIMPYTEDKYHIVARYGYEEYPANPNGSHYNTAMLANHDGRHLVMMPHIERSVFRWNWAWYPEERRQDKISPWIQAFVNAREWLENHAV